MPRLLLAFVGLTVLHLAGLALHQEPLAWATKPLLVPLLAGHLWRCTAAAHRPVLVGLALATAGDVALLLPGDAAFLAGTGFFFGTQLCYLLAFVRQGAVRWLRNRWWLWAGSLAVWAAANALLVPALGALAWAVVPYSFALVSMAATAWVLGTRAAWGGALFVGSDLLIGLGATGAGFTGRDVLVMATYAAAQFLLVGAFTRARRPTSGGRTAARGGAAARAH